MRSIIVAFYLLLYAIVSLPLFLIFYIKGKFSPSKKAYLSQKFVNNFGFRPILFLSGVRLTVKGRENILQDQAALYVFNHRGFYDILAGYTTAPYPTAFVSKKEIGKVPMVSRWMKYMNCLFLDRSDIRQGLQTILQGVLYILHRKVQEIPVRNFWNFMLPASNWQKNQNARLYLLH